ncbi:MAG: ATP-binding protein [Vicinamibacterales bacterium]|nr:ATP-binding protein [Vicinamibacterales bacterium]
MAPSLSWRARLALPAGIVAVWLTLVTLTWVAVETQARFDEEQALAAATERTRNLAIAFEQYAIRTIEGADDIIRAVAYGYGHAGNALDLPGLVNALGVDLGAYDAISLVDATGSVVPSGTVPPIAAPINIADREHFLVHRDQEMAGPFIGRPVRSRRSGRDMVPITRRLNGRDGQFAGVVSVQFEPSRFTAVYGEATQGARGVISLIGRDGVTRARRVGDRLSSGEDITGARLMAEWAARPDGTYIGPGGVDGVLRLFSYRTVGAYPLVAVVGEAVDDVLFNTRARKRTYRWAAAAVTAGTSLSAGLLLAAFIRGRRMYERLDASHGRFKGIFDHTGDAMLLADGEGRYLDANPGACAMLGYPREALLGKTAADLVVGYGTGDTSVLWAQFLADGVMSGELQLRRSDGEIIDVEYRAVANIEPGVHLSVLHDVTERRVLETRTRRAQRMESLGTLAGGIAHDLNNALTPILLSTEMLREDEADPRRRELLGGIEDSARRGAHMVQQLLSFARGVDGERVDVAPGEIVQAVASIARDTFLKHVRIQTTVGEGLQTIAADPMQIHQVLLNLCLNARDAMPEGGTLTMTAVDVEVDERFATRHPDAAAGPYVRITVADTGTGIPVNVVDRIFDPFFTTKPFGQGTGLGLPTSLAIVRSHGGFLWVESEPGRGTRVHVYLPVGGASGTGAGTVEAPLPPRGEGQCVLVIDDEATVREAVHHALEAHGYRVRLAAGGAQGVAAYASHHDEIVAVITDMMMPGMDGVATMGALRRIDPAVRLIAATGLPEEARLARARDAGAAAVVAKPFTTATLLRALHEALTSAAAPEGADSR